MVLVDEQQVIHVWDAFADADFRYASHDGEIYEFGTANDERRERLPVRQDLLQNFFDGELELESFKSEMASESGRHKLWGYSGASGGMFFNMLVSAADADAEPDLAQLLREVLVAPDDKEAAAEQIRQLENGVEQIRDQTESAHSAPQTGYIPYFVSYFWQLQEPDTYPIYYKSMRDALSDLGIWEPSGDHAQDYIEFWELNEEIRDVLEDHTEQDIHLWTIERMFLFWLSRDEIVTSSELTEEQVTILQQWKNAASQLEQAIHFNFEDPYDPEDAQQRAREFIESPSRQTFHALWDPMHSAQRLGAATKIYEKWNTEKGRSDEELADLIDEIHKADEYDLSWEGELGAKRTVWELFGLLHIDEYPIINGSAERGLSFFGYECPDDYVGCVEQFEAFKDEYERQVGHATADTDHAVSLNFEIDQLLNVIDKVEEGDPDEETHEVAAELYRTVLEVKDEDGPLDGGEYGGIEEATNDILQRLETQTTGENWLGDLILESVVREWTDVLRRNDLVAGDINQEDLPTIERILELYRNNETRLEDQADAIGAGWVGSLTNGQTLFVVLLRDLQDRAGVSSPNFNHVKMWNLLNGGHSGESAEPLAPIPAPPDDARTIERQITRAGQLVFHGPPGTGKTYTAQRFARWWLAQQTDDPTETQLEVVTFHPSFTYEDFIEGLTAEEHDGAVEYRVKAGVFKRLCDRAREAYTDAGADAKPFILIIDEINRGNLAQIFGETITLLEPDKRMGAENETTARLPHSKERFTVPPNIYLIGTMNTADRSIALVDAALRRRFRFIAFPPKSKVLYDEYGFSGAEDVEKAAETSADSVRQLLALSIKGIEALNESILDSPNLGKGKQIGHSYFIDVDEGDTTTERLQSIVDAWQYEILPLLEEYYFGQFDRIQQDLFDGGGGRLFDWDTEQIKAFDPDDLAQSLLTLTGTSAAWTGTEQVSTETAFTYQHLLEHDIIRRGDELVFDSEKVPEGATKAFDKADAFWRCEVTGETGQQDNVRWKHNDELYSLSGLAQTILEEISDHEGKVNGPEYWCHPQYDSRHLSELRKEHEAGELEQAELSTTEAAGE